MQKFHRQRGFAFDASNASEYLGLVHKKDMDSEEDTSSDSDKNGLTKHIEMLLNLLDFDDLNLSHKPNSIECPDELGHSKLYRILPGKSWKNSWFFGKKYENFCEKFNKNKNIRGKTKNENKLKII